MKTKVLSLLLAAALIVTTFAACGGEPASSSSQSSESSASSESSTADSDSSESSTESSQASAGDDIMAARAVHSPDDDLSQPYSYVTYANYDWWTLHPWGVDAASAKMKELFNVDVEWQKPDADPAAKFNLMISSGDIPDALFLDRTADFVKIAKLGLLVDLNTLKYDGCTIDEDLDESTQKINSYDGKFYMIPNWSRRMGTGGNYSWLINQEAWKAVGSPELKTLEDVHQCLLKMKDAGLKSSAGADLIPFMVGDTPDGGKILDGFYRSFGGTPRQNCWTARVDGKMQFLFRDPVAKEALKEANKWYREGLMTDTIVTDTVDQVNEKLSTGRAGIAFYDFSQDSVTHFRQILMESTGGANSYEVLTDPIFPAAEGVEKVYGEENAGAGGSGIVITTTAKNPQRIFDLNSWMLTKDGSLNMMYGPQGGLWDELDEDGLPVLKKAESEFTTEEKDAQGCWMWASPAQSDNVDNMKFALNALQPAEKQDWVITLQANVFSQNAGGSYKDGQKFVSNESVDLNLTIDPQEDLGIQRTLIENQVRAELPKMILAPDDATFDSIYQGLIDFADQNGMKEIEAKYDAKYQENCELQGGSFYAK